MSGNLRKYGVYAGTLLASLGLIAVSLAPVNFRADQLEFFQRRSLLSMPLPAVMFIFGRHFPGWAGVLSVIGAYLFLYLSGMVMLFLIPRQFGVMRRAFMPEDGRGSWKSWLYFLGVGALSLLALSLLDGLGLITAAAFPLPLFMLALLLLVIWVGLITFALVVGAEVNRLAGVNNANTLGELALGLLVVFAFGRLPFIGWLLTLLMIVLALGAVVATRLGYGGNWNLHGLEHPVQPITTDASDPQDWRGDSLDGRSHI